MPNILEAAFKLKKMCVTEKAAALQLLILVKKIPKELHHFIFDSPFIITCMKMVGNGE